MWTVASPPASRYYRWQAGSSTGDNQNHRINNPGPMPYRAKAAFESCTDKTYMADRRTLICDRVALAVTGLMHMAMAQQTLIAAPGKEPS